MRKFSFLKDSMKKLLSIFKNFLKRLRENEPSLANFVKKQKKTNKELTKILSQRHEPLWVPSRRSFLIIFFCILPFGILAHFNLFHTFFIWTIHHFNNFFDIPLCSFELWLNKVCNFFYYLDFETNTHFSNLISIHTGIGAVLIGLAFFVAQSLIDKNDPDKGRVLLYKSHFFPLLTAEILIFLIFIWGAVNLFAFVAIIILALFTIYFLGGTINILIKDYEMEKAKKKMFFAVLKSNFIKILDQEIRKRIGRNYLNKKGEDIEKETNSLVKLTPFGIYYEYNNYIPIIAERPGIVTDISFKELKKLIAEIKKIANKHNNKKYKCSTPETTEKSSPISKQETIVYVRPQFLGYTSEISNELIQIREDLFDEECKAKDLENLKKIVSSVFTIQQLPEIEKEARLEISKIKDRCLKAINKQETGELGKIVDFYVDLAREFFTYINLYGGGFSSEQAEKERTSFFERLKPIEWLSRDIREIFEKGLQSDDINVIREVAYLPIRLANEAIEHKDHLVFQEFIYFPQLLYSYAYDRKDSNEKISKFMFDRTWRYLKELSDYHLESKLKKNKCDEENFTGFAVHLLKVFQSLIKASFDKRDFENFENFLLKASVLFKHLSRQHFYDNEEDNIFDKINKKRQEMFFGVTSWILFITESNKDNTEIKKYFETCKQYLPSDIQDLTEIFLNVHDFDVEHFWGWSNWELEGKSEDSEFAHGINILEKLEKLYAIQSLKILQPKNAQEIEKIKLPHTRELAFLAEGTRDLLKILDNIKSNSENWKFVLNDQEISKVDKFKELLEKARKAQEEGDLQRKREAQVSKTKINEFKKNVVKNFYESHGIRNVLKYYGLVIDESIDSYEGEIKKLGINTMFDKAPFFDESVKWHAHFMGDDNGFDFGRSLINGENNEIIKIIQKNLNLIKKEELESQLAIYDLKNTLIISLNGVSWKFLEEKSNNYIPKWQLQSKKIYPDKIAGIYQFENYEIPVYEIYNGSKSKDLLVLDKNNFGKIVQYSPLDKDESKEFQQDIFYMDVGVFTDDSDLMKKFLESPPDWLKEIGDKEAQKNHLKERVVIKIFERFEFKLAEKVKGFKININE
ncbi:MAG: hypothetical protein A2Y41_11165 [Spirochaetes bacterium GWB1_36_13]|nr:MAG: hypothetical protein A2Y41_11165 [Spirochaetes bacterium GWB1_36_13]